LPELHIPVRAWPVERRQVDARHVRDGFRIAMGPDRVAAIVADTMPVERRRGVTG
jgi:hypothetical protein